MQAFFLEALINFYLIANFENRLVIWFNILLYQKKISFLSMLNYIPNTSAEWIWS